MSHTWTHNDEPESEKSIAIGHFDVWCFVRVLTDDGK